MCITFLRQKREKGLREKKDQKILQMALEQKKKMAEGKKVNERKLFKVTKKQKTKHKQEIYCKYR